MQWETIRKIFALAIAFVAPYKSGPSKAWLKIKNAKAPAATRVIEGTF
jgi:hypothetical protein